MKELKLQNESLCLRSKRNEFKLEQLNRKSVLETDRLRRQVEHLGAAIQKLLAQLTPP